MSDLKTELRQIYESEGPKLYGYLLKSADAELAQDIMQETFARLYARLEKSADIANAKAYLFQIARHLLYRETAVSRRFSSAEAEIEKLADVETNDSDERELLSALQRAVKELDSKEHELYDLRWNRGLTQVEIASVLNKSERQIRRDLEKLTTRFRQLFRELGYEETPEALKK